MQRGRISYPMRSRLPASFGALVLFGGCALFAFAARGGLLDGTLALLLGLGSLAFVAMAAVSIVNLMLHEGWEVVLAEDAIELPAAPYRSRRRERFPYAAIEFVGLAPSPPDEPEMVVIHVSPEPHIRWIRGADLEAGTVTEVARRLIERVSDVRGDGRVVRAEHQQ